MSDTDLALSEPLLSSTGSDYVIIGNDRRLYCGQKANKKNEIVALNEVDGQWKLYLSYGF